MNILVIGNGFDLAHGLPTKYMDFLEFVKRIKIISSTKKKSNFNRFKQDYLDDWNVNKEVVSYIGRIFKDRIEGKIIKELFTLVKDNFWLDYFIQSENYVEQGWIDFEKEISSQIQKIDCSWKKRIEIAASVTDEILDIKEYSVFFKHVTKIELAEGLREKDFEYIRDKLLLDLERMIRCLEIYLSDCVAQIPFISILEDIAEIKFDKILSFNYTDTYKNLYAMYDENLEYDFIHGKASITNNIATNNMVLGIDEYLTGESISREINFIAFKKYFQRIHKETGCKYKDWIEKIREDEGEIHNVYIFGHSLDVTDGDVLREMILNENVKTTIFYYDKNVYGAQIKNLVQVISRDELIKRVYGTRRSITFKEQREPMQIQPQNMELQKDITRLKKIHSLTNKEIRDLVDKIQNRIKGKNLFYISNVKDLIVLYSVTLNSNLFENLDRKYFIDIARELVNKSQQDILITDCKEICKCDDDRVETLWEIIINLYKGASKKYTKDNFEKLLVEKSARELVKFCEHYRITDENQFERTINIMLNKFNAGNVNVELVFEQIFKILDSTEPSIVRKGLEKQMLNEKDTIRKARLEFLYRTVVEKSQL